jgi:hypothetical protein
MRRSVGLLLSSRREACSSNFAVTIRLPRVAVVYSLEKIFTDTFGLGRGEDIRPSLDSSAYRLASSTCAEAERQAARSMARAR